MFIHHIREPIRKQQQSKGWLKLSEKVFAKSHDVQSR
jgi:hypothetical protein